MTPTSGDMAGARRSLRISFSTSGRGRRREVALARQGDVAADLVVVLRLFLDLLADGAQLLVQHHLPLAVLDALLHLLGDLLLDGEHGVLLGQQLEQRQQALFGGGDLQQALLLLHADQQVGGDDVGDLAGVGRLAQHLLRLVGDLRVELHVGAELGDHATREGLAAARVAVRRRQRRVVDHELGRDALEGVDVHPLAALDQRLHAAVGRLEDLQHGGHGADRQDVVGAGVVLQRLALRGEDEAGLLGVRALQRAHALLAPHEEGRDHLGEHDQLARGHERERRPPVGAQPPLPVSGRLLVKLEGRLVGLGDQRGVEALLDGLARDARTCARRAARAGRTSRPAAPPR